MTAHEKTFEEATQTIREWLDHGCVSTDRLHVELLAWALWSAPSPRRNPCSTEDAA